MTNKQLLQGMVLVFVAVLMVGLIIVGVMG
jgi:hypothetical protein